MDSRFFIAITMKTCEGPVTIGNFFIGNNPTHANAIFSSLHGTTEVNEDNLLVMDFMEQQRGLPLNLKMLSCTLEQLGENCRIIAKELFKHTNLGLT